MRVLIAAPGPTLLDTLPVDPWAKYDHIVAVNWAAEYVAADWLVALDQETLLKPRRPIRPDRLVGICTTAQAWQHVPPFAGRAPLQIVNPWLLHPLIAQVGLSFPAALALALRHLGATSVDLHGVTWAGNHHIDGAPVNYCNPDRWRTEARTAAQLQADHPTVTIRRHLPTGALPVTDPAAAATPPTTPVHRPRRGRPTLAEVVARPAPAPVEVDTGTGRWRCQHCGAPTLRVAGSQRNGTTPMRCTTCGQSFAYYDRMLQAIRIR